MKKIIFIVLICIIIPYHLFANNKVVRLCEDPWPPYILGNMGKTATGGSAVKIITEVFNRIEGIDVDFNLFPWKRCLKNIKNGSADGYIIALYSDDREKYLTVSDHYLTSRGVWYYAKKRFPDGFEWNSYQDFGDYTIGAINGYTYKEEFDSADKQGIINVRRLVNEGRAFNLLIAGRIDFYPSNEKIGDLAIQNSGLGRQIGKLEKPLFQALYRMSLGKKSRYLYLLPQINEILEELKSEGFIDRVVRENDK